MPTVPLTDSKRKNRSGKHHSKTCTNIPWTPTVERGLTCPLQKTERARRMDLCEAAVYQPGRKGDEAISVCESIDCQSVNFMDGVVSGF
jgi:hypothetical protein